MQNAFLLVQYAQEEKRSKKEKKRELCAHLLPRHKPRPNGHPAYPFRDLRGAASVGLLFKKLLRHVQFRSRIFLVGRDRLGKAVREICPSLSKMAGNSNRVDHVAVFSRVQKGPTTSQCVVDLLRRTGFVIVESQEVAKTTPEIQRPLCDLNGKRWWVRCGLANGRLLQWVGFHVVAGKQGLHDIETFRSRQQIKVLAVIPVRHVHHVATQGYGAPNDRCLKTLQSSDNIGILEVSIVERVDQCGIFSHELRVRHNMG